METSGAGPRFRGTTWIEDAQADRLDSIRERATRQIDPSFALIVTSLDQAQAALLVARTHTTNQEAARWLDATISDALSEAEALHEQAVRDAADLAPPV